MAMLLTPRSRGRSRLPRCRGQRYRCGRDEGWPRDGMKVSDPSGGFQYINRWRIEQISPRRATHSSSSAKRYMRALPRSPCLSISASPRPCVLLGGPVRLASWKRVHHGPTAGIIRHSTGGGLNRCHQDEPRTVQAASTGIPSQALPACLSLHPPPCVLIWGPVARKGKRVHDGPTARIRPSD